MKKYTIVLLAALLILLSSCAADGTSASINYSGAVKGFCNFLVYDVEDIKGFAPDGFWSYMAETEGFSVYEEESAENIASYIADNRESFVKMYGEDIKITYSISEKTELKESSYQEKIAFFADTYGIENVDGMQRVTVDFKIKGELDSMENTIDILVVKIDGKWYPCATSGYFFVHPYASAAIAY